VTPRLAGRLRPIALALVWLTAALRGDQRVTLPYVGITYIDRTEQSPRPLHMHVVQIDLTAPGLRFAVSPPGGTREAVRQTTLEYLRQTHAQVAINGHFFLPFPSADADAWLVGLAASDGRVYSAFETPDQRYALVADVPALNIDSSNHATIVHRDASQGDGRHVVESVTLWNAVSGSAQIVTDGVVTVPAYADDQRLGAEVQQPASAAKAALGAEAAQPAPAAKAALLEPGGPGTYSNERSWYDVTTARTAIGLSRDGRTLTLFTVDVRGGSEGMRVAEVADVLVRDYQVWNALNLDGGGSTSMALEDPATHEAAIVNTSSDNPAGRPVGSSLAVFARPR
jgi:hypothetical protein